MLKVFKFRGKRYIIDLDVLFFNLFVLTLVIAFVIGFCYVSKQEYLFELNK